MKSVCIRKRENSAYRVIFIEYVVGIGPYEVKILSINMAGMKTLENITLSPYPCEGLRESLLCYGSVIGTFEALPDFCEYGIQKFLVT